MTPQHRENGLPRGEFDRDTSAVEKENGELANAQGADIKDRRYGR
jgi:hypothetical protein